MPLELPNEPASPIVRTNIDNSEELVDENGNNDTSEQSSPSSSAEVDSESSSISSDTPTLIRLNVEAKADNNVCFVCPRLRNCYLINEIIVGTNEH